VFAQFEKTALDDREGIEMDSSDFPRSAVDVETISSIVTREGCGDADEVFRSHLNHAEQGRTRCGLPFPLHPLLVYSALLSYSVSGRERFGERKQWKLNRNLPRDT